MAKKGAKKRGKRLELQYVVNARGKITDVIIPISMYRRLLESLEDAEDIRDIREAMKDPDTIPLEQVRRELGLEDTHDSALSRRPNRAPRESLDSAKRKLTARKRRATGG